MSSTPESVAAKGHVRNASSVDERRVAVPRRRTKGPLDFEENPPIPTTTPTPPAPSSTPPPATPATLFASPFSPQPITKDLTPLRHPPLFHPLPPTLLPPTSSSTPPPAPNTSPSTLLSRGHFRLAAITAATLLTSPAPLTAPQIFSLHYTRLSALCLLNCVPLASQEAKALAPFAPELPWALRVLLVRLQAVAYGDWRRSIGGYYELGREARAAVIAGGVGGLSPEVWRGRLAELGVRVASALVEMGDLGGASRHLASLQGGSGGVELVAARVLLFLRIGDVPAASAALESLPVSDDEAARRILEALVVMAEGRWPEAVELWGGMEGIQGVAEEMRVVNLAVSLLYCGRLEEARGTLEGLVGALVDGRDVGDGEDLLVEGEKGALGGKGVFAGLVFNLCTVYELCSDGAKGLKAGLAERVKGGVEVSVGAFKM